MSIEEVYDKNVVGTMDKYFMKVFNLLKEHGSHGKYFQKRTGFVNLYDYTISFWYTFHKNTA